MLTSQRNGVRALVVGVFSCVVMMAGLNGAAANPHVDYGEEESETVDPGPPEPGAEGCDPAPGFSYCYNGLSCSRNDPAAVQDPTALRDEPAPYEGAHVIHEWCDDGSYEWFWSTEDDGPSLVERIRRARGEITIPEFQPSFNPPGFTVVNVATWWWADGLPSEPILGSVALSIRAVATPSHMTVDPGDGSSSFRCEFSVAESDACDHEYRRASHNASGRDADGRPAFTASVTVVYDLHFEIAGERVDIPADVPEDLLTLERTEEVPVRVVEIQSIVRRGR